LGLHRFGIRVLYNGRFNCLEKAHVVADFYGFISGHGNSE
jgi:hypothetical protein